VARPLCGAVHRARLLAALGRCMAMPEQGVVQANGGPIDAQFYQAAYRRGALSLSVEHPAASSSSSSSSWSSSSPAPAPAAAPAAAAPGWGSELRAQSPASLDRELRMLHALGDEAGVALTRLMATMAQGMEDFVRDMRDLPPAWRWSKLPEPRALRHSHFGVSAAAHGGYRLDVSACLETERPDMEIHLALAMQFNATAGRVTRLIAPPAARLLLASEPGSGNAPRRPVTTAGIRGAMANA
jgi:hypothetical protein